MFHPHHSHKMPSLQVVAGAGTARRLPALVGNKPRGKPASDNRHRPPTRVGTRLVPRSHGWHTLARPPSRVTSVPRHILPDWPWKTHQRFRLQVRKLPGEALTAECTVNRQMSCGCAPLEKKAAQVSHCFAHTHYLNCKGTKTDLSPA